MARQDKQVCVLHVCMARQDKQVCVLHVCMARQDKQVCVLHVCMARQDKQVCVLHVCMATQDKQVCVCCMCVWQDKISKYVCCMCVWQDKISKYVCCMCVWQHKISKYVCCMCVWKDIIFFMSKGSSININILPKTKCLNKGGREFGSCSFTFTHHLKEKYIGEGMCSLMGGEGGSLFTEYWCLQVFYVWIIDRAGGQYRPISARTAKWWGLISVRYCPPARSIIHLSYALFPPRTCTCSYDSAGSKFIVPVNTTSE